MRIQHNIMAMNSYRNYTNNANSLSKNLEKLSSGYKINRAGDDAAGLAISEKMRAQITGLDAAQKNVKDGISLVKTAEGAMDEIHSMLKRMDYLATQSANGTYDEETDRDQLQKEINQLRSEINRIADSSNFNGIKLLDGSLSGKSQVDNIQVTTTTAQKGVFEAATNIAKSGDFNLTVEDIGKTFDYIVNWKDNNGDIQTTTITLTFQGDGTNTISTTAANNYFTDKAGNKYALAAGSTASVAGVKLYSFSGTQAYNAIKNGLTNDDLFSSQFIIDGTGQQFKFTARQEGAGKAEIISIGFTSSTGQTPYATAGSKAFKVDFRTTTLGMDSMQRINFTGKAMEATKGMTMDAISKLIFEIDGHKFLLNNGSGTNGLTANQIKALGSDVTIIKLQGATYTASKDAEKVAAEIARVTGLGVKGYATAATAIYAADKSGIIAGDIVFTEDHLKLGGTELQLQIGDTADSYNQLKVKIKDLHTTAIGISEIDISNQDGAAEAIDVIKNAINYVSDVRGTLGATQNRLEHTQNNLSVMAENIQDAESTIRDTDVAEEMMSYVKNNILVQSAQAMLAQANQVPQGVLQLLG